MTAHVSCLVAVVAGLMAPSDRLPALRMTSRLVMPVMLSPVLPEVAGPLPTGSRTDDIRLSKPAEPAATPAAAAESLVAAPAGAPDGVGPEAPFEAAAESADSTGTDGSAVGGEGGATGGDGIGRGPDSGGHGTGGAPAARRLEAGIRPPRKVKDVRPEYPAGALRDQMRGTVVLDVTIGVDGRVVDAAVVRSIPELDRAALDAVRQWEFVPASLNGTPIAVIVTVIVNFSIL
jgi:protein TonB